MTPSSCVVSVAPLTPCLAPPGWTYRSETKDKVPSIPKILQLEQQRKFSPAGLCASFFPILSVDDLRLTTLGRPHRPPARLYADVHGLWRPLLGALVLL